MITGVHHIAIRTTDIERSAAFYRDVLRMTERKRLHFPDGTYLIMLGVGETCVELFGGGKLRDMTEDAGEIGFTHIALAVDDVDGEYARIRALGYSFHVEPRTVQGLRVAFFRDPDGISIELLQEL